MVVPGRDGEDKDGHPLKEPKHQGVGQRRHALSRKLQSNAGSRDLEKRRTQSWGTNYREVGDGRWPPEAPAKADCKGMVVGMSWRGHHEKPPTPPQKKIK